MRAQVPLLRFQFPRGTGRTGRAGLRGCAAYRPGAGRGRRAGGGNPLHRRRYPQPFQRWSHHPPAAGNTRYPGPGQWHRNHPGSQSRRRRCRPFRGLSWGRGEPALHRHTVLRRGRPATARAHPRCAAGRGSLRDRPCCGFRKHQPGPDVRPAATEAGRGPGRPAQGHRAGTRTPLLVPAHPGTSYPFPPPSASASRRRSRLGDAGTGPGTARQGGLRPLRNFHPCPWRMALPPQPELLALRRLPGYRGRSPWQDHRRGGHPLLEGTPPGALPGVAWQNRQ